ncbi:hypothetical protein NS226_08975 [Aureimonas ureilytica]|uniref:Uncharacterized protein n=1 Tax=Aureimonas ureilytica TaxID=401562 RepID=A0A175R8R5_9HYPH|nr:hypothetical protein NS226_08975 [Aureimonas ureilytica]
MISVQSENAERRGRPENGRSASRTQRRKLTFGTRPISVFGDQLTGWQRMTLKLPITLNEDIL